MGERSPGTIRRRVPRGLADGEWKGNLGPQVRLSSNARWVPAATADNLTPAGDSQILTDHDVELSFEPLDTLYAWTVRNAEALHKLTKRRTRRTSPGESAEGKL